MHVALKTVDVNWVVARVLPHHAVFKKVERLQAHNYALNSCIPAQSLCGKMQGVLDFTRPGARLASSPRNYNFVFALDVVAEVSMAIYPLHGERATFLALPPVTDALGIDEEATGKRLSFGCPHRRIVAAWFANFQKLCGVSGHTWCKCSFPKSRSAWKAMDCLGFPWVPPNTGRAKGLH